MPSASRDQIFRSLSSSFDDLGRPFLRAADVGEVDAVQQHGELGGVELGAEGVLVELREAKAALLKALVEDDEAAVVPGEDLHPVPPPRDEDEEVAGEDVLLPAGADERRQAVNRLAVMQSTA